LEIPTPQNWMSPGIWSWYIGVLFKDGHGPNTVTVSGTVCRVHTHSHTAHTPTPTLMRAHTHTHTRTRTHIHARTRMRMNTHEVGHICKGTNNHMLLNIPNVPAPSSTQGHAVLHIRAYGGCTLYGPMTIRSRQKVKVYSLKPSPELPPMGPT
jgi:hypothetical protein